LTTDTPTDAATVDEEIILGVDTHNDAHVAAVITTVGALLDTRAFPTTTAGYADLVDWVRRHGRLRRAGVEGTSSHGTTLTRHLHRNGVQVIEVNRPDRGVRRRRGKTDAIDAENAARAVLSGQAAGLAKGGDGAVETIRMFKIAKDSAVKAPHAGHQPAQGRAGASRPDAAGVAERPRSRRADPRLRGPAATDAPTAPSTPSS
jgi:transposase